MAKPIVLTARELRFADCHPDRIHHCNGLCQKCHRKSYYHKNKKYFNEQAKLYRLQNKERIRRTAKLCYQRRNAEWKAQEAKKKRDYYEEIKRKIFSIYGDSCNRCGMSDKRCLQLDHVNGGGRRLKHKRGKELAAKIINGKLKKEDFQILCANCNWIKRWENNECNRPI